MKLLVDMNLRRGGLSFFPAESLPLCTGPASGEQTPQMRSLCPTPQQMI